MIKSITGLKGSHIQWAAVGDRLKGYRESQNITLLEASKQLELSEHQTLALERGFDGYDRKDVNIIFRISQRWDLSLNWLLNGKGLPNGEDPPELMPQTLIVQKGAGIRRSELRVSAEQGEFTDEVMEFVIAIDKYSRVNDIPFPSKTQLFELILALGYRKSGTARIAPLGYVIKKQKEQEKQNLLNEPMPEPTNLEKARHKLRDKPLEETPEESIELVPLVAPIHVKEETERKQKHNQKRRLKRKLKIALSSLSDAEKERRRKIGERTKVRGKQYLFVDPEGREYMIDSSKESVPDFCKKNGLMPAHMYSCANGSRPQHKGWKAHIIYQAPPENIENQENTEEKQESAAPKDNVVLSEPLTNPPDFLSNTDLPENERNRRMRISDAFRGKLNTKQYLITNPDGQQFVTKNGLNEFCRQHGLDSNNMSAVATGRRKHHRGWKAQHITEDHEQTRSDEKSREDRGNDFQPLPIHVGTWLANSGT